MINQKGIALPVIILVVLFLVISLGGIWDISYKNNQPAQHVTTNQKSQEPLLSPSPTTSTFAAWTISTDDLGIIDYSLTDEAGNTSGYVPGATKFLNDLPDGSYEHEAGTGGPLGRIYFGQNDPTNGKYVFKIYGLTTGSFVLNIEHIAGQTDEGPFETKKKTIADSIEKSESQTYEITLPQLNVQKIPK